MLDANQQAALTVALAGFGIAPQSLQFSYAPTLVCGIALHLGGWALAWNLDDYLQGQARRSSTVLPSQHPKRANTQN